LFDAFIHVSVVAHVKLEIIFVIPFGKCSSCPGKSAICSTTASINKSIFNATKAVCSTGDHPKTAMLGMPEGSTERFDGRIVTCVSCKHFVLCFTKPWEILFLIVSRIIVKNKAKQNEHYAGSNIGEMVKKGAMENSTFFAVVVRQLKVSYLVLRQFTGGCRDCIAFLRNFNLVVRHTDEYNMSAFHCNSIFIAKT